MSDPEEIEVEVVEVSESVPVSRPSRPTDRPTRESTSRPDPGGRRPFSGQFSINSRRVPFYLWPLILIFGLIFGAIFLLIALVVFVVVVIPVLIIRTILRLLFPPSR